jgi:hypothetical protein
MPSRDQFFTARMSTDEMDAMRSVARHYGESIANMLRKLVAREVESIGETTLRKECPQKLKVKSA